MKLCNEWINLSLQGIDFYNTYYKLPLLICVTFVGLGWITLLIIETNSIKKYRQINKFHKLLINVIFLIFAIASCVFINGKFISNIVLMLKFNKSKINYFIAGQSLPLQFYVYALMPLTLWWICITKIIQVFDLSHIKQIILQVKGLELFEVLFYLVGIELLVIYYLRNTIFK